MAKKKEIKSSENISNEKLCAVLSYLLIGIIWYFVDDKMKQSEFAKFHVKQGIILFIVDVIIWAISGIPIIGLLAAPILWVIFLVILIIGIINAANGKEKELPIMGQFAKELTF